MREVHGWRRVRRWIGASALGVVAIVVIAVIGVVIAMQTGWGQELVRRQVEAKLADTFVGGAKMGHIEGTPFTDIVVRDLVINGPDGKPAIAVGALRLRVGLLPLITHQLVLRKLVADDVDVLLDRDRDGDLRIQRLMKPGPPTTWNVRLPAVEVHRAHVAFDTGEQKIDLDDIQIDGNAKLPHGGPIDVAAIVSAKWRQKDAPIDISAVLHSDSEQVRVPSALIRIADLEVAATGVHVAKGRGVTGSLAVSAPAATVARLAPEIDVPVDVALAVEAERIGSETALAISGAIGGAPLRGFAHADLRSKQATGFVSAANVDLFAITRGGFDGLAGAVAAFDVAPAARDEELPRAHAMLQAWSERGDIPRIDLLAAIDSARDRAHLALGATGAAGLRAAADIAIAKHAGAITLERAVAIARTRDPARATGGKTPVHGALDLDVTANGPLAPHPDLAITGHVDGRALRFQELSAASLALRVDARHLPAQPIGTARVELVDLARGDLQLGKLTVAAGNRPDGKIQVSVRSQPKQAPWLVDVDALVTPGETVSVDMQRHFVRGAGGATWRGNTGRIAIGPHEISVRDLRSTSDGGNLAVDATYARDTGDLRGKLAAALDLSSLKSTLVGRLDATVDVERAAKRWRGAARAKASRVSISQIALDADAKLEARDGRVTLDATAGSARTGHAKITADVAAPIDLANAPAWRSLTRTALRSIDVELDGVDLQSVAKLAHARPMAGRVDGRIEIKSGETRGEVHVRGLCGDEIRDLGELAADLKLEPHGRDELEVQATAQVHALGAVALGARVSTPERVLDPAAWKRLGVGALRGARLRTGELAFEPGTLEKLGLVTSFRGRATLSAEVGPALETAKVTLDVRQLRGGVLAMPVNAHVEASADRKDTRATVAVHANGIELVDVHATIPVALDRLRSGSRRAAASDGRAAERRRAQAGRGARQHAGRRRHDRRRDRGRRDRRQADRDRRDRRARCQRAARHRGREGDADDARAEDRRHLGRHRSLARHHRHREQRRYAARRRKRCAVRARRRHRDGRCVEARARAARRVPARSRRWARWTARSQAIATRRRAEDRAARRQPARHGGAHSDRAAGRHVVPRRCNGERARPHGRGRRAGQARQRLGQARRQCAARWRRAHRRPGPARDQEGEADRRDTARDRRRCRRQGRARRRWLACRRQGRARQRRHFRGQGR
jgi:hypothetical protein